MLRKWGTLVLLLLAMPALALAQSTGKLSGTVMDQDTGEPLPGASISLVGTQLGTLSDIDGNYFIIGVPVGQYDVQASFVGYQTETLTDVDILSGRTREINFNLGAGVELDEIVVEYERPLIQKDAIGVPKVVTAEEITNLPVRGIAGVAALQGGVVSTETSSTLNIRGGRGEEVAYFVDGVRVIGSASVPTQAIQEQEMLIGSIPAKYGDAMSGVISITTKGGTTPDFYGSVEGITSEVLDDYGYNTVTAAIGGPIVKNRAAFFLSAEFADRADSGPRAIAFPSISDDMFDFLQNNPQAVEVMNEEGVHSYFPLSGGFADSVRAGIIAPDAIAGFIAGTLPDTLSLVDGAHPQPIFAPNAFTSADLSESNARANNGSQDITINGNVTFNPVQSIRIRLGGSFNKSEDQSFSYLRSIYANDRFLQLDRQTYRVNGAWTHYISNNTFYQLQADFSDYEGENYWNGFDPGVENVLFYGDIDHPANATAARYITFDTQDEEYELAYSDGILPNVRDIQSNFAPPGATQNNYGKFHSRQFGFRASATTQLGLHQVEFGGEYQQRTQRSYGISPDQWSRRYVDPGCTITRDADGDIETVTAPADPNFTGDCTPDSSSRLVTAWDQLGYDDLRNSVSYYGYNPNGTKEVDDQSIAGLYNGTNTNIAPYQPIYYAGYISDKLEYRDIVLQIGARVDVFDNNTLTLRDPYSLFPIERASSIGSRPSNIGADYAVYFEEGTGDAVGYRDLEGNFYTIGGELTDASDIVLDLGGKPKVEEGEIDNGDGTTRQGALLRLTDDVFTDYEPQVNFQPRVGVSFPVTDRALFYASYDVVTQRPTENQFTTIHRYRLAAENSSRVNNPALEPERTTQYELGFRQRVGERAAIQLSGFFRQIENKISRRIVQNVFPSNYQTYRNVDFGTVKGVEMEFDLRRTNNLQLNANYTLSFAQGTGADSDAVSQITWRSETDPFYPRFLSPLDFDQRHKLNLTVDYRLGEGQGPRVGSAYPLSNLGFNLVATVGTGLPYTRRTDASPLYTGFNGELNGQINGENQPSTALLNLRVDRRFKLGQANLVAYLWVQNLLDSDNVQFVYSQTGLAETDGYLSGPEGLDAVKAIAESQGDLQAQSFVDHYRLAADSPFNYGIPRLTRIGVRLDF